MFTNRKLTFCIGVLISILVMSGFVVAQDRALSPTETATQLFASVEKKDTEAFKALLCKNVRGYLEKSERKEDRLQLLMGVAGMATPDKSASASEKIEGGKATVTFTKKNADGSNESSTVELSKEGERWTGFCLDEKQLQGFTLSDTMASAMAAAKAVEDPKIRKEIEDFYVKRDQAFKAKDIAAFKSMELDEYTSVMWVFMPTVANRQEADENAANLMQVYKVLKEVSTKVDSVKQSGNENEVLVETTQAVRWTDQSGGNNSLDAKYHDTLVRTKDGWKIGYSELIEFNQKTQ